MSSKNINYYQYMHSNQLVNKQKENGPITCHVNTCTCIWNKKHILQLTLNSTLIHNITQKYQHTLWNEYTKTDIVFWQKRTKLIRNLNFWSIRLKWMDTKAVFSSIFIQGRKLLRLPEYQARSYKGILLKRRIKSFSLRYIPTDRKAKTFWQLPLL